MATILNEQMKSVTEYLFNSEMGQLFSDNFCQMVKVISPVLVQLIMLILITSLAILEIKVKLEARALQILLTKNKFSTRRVLVLNFAQIVLYLTSVYFKVCSPELQAVAAYSLFAKLIQTNWNQIKVDIISIGPTFLYAFLVTSNNQISSIEHIDEIIVELTQQVLPVILTYLSIVLYPFICITICSLYIAYCFFWFLALIRRKFPDDFDFFLTLAIAILAFKTVKRDLVQRQVKDVFCSKLKLPPPPGNAVDDYKFSPAQSGYELSGLTSDSESNSQRILQHWCYSQDDILRSIARVGQKSGNVQYGAVEEVVKPENMSYLDFYTELFTSYRGYYILSAQQGSSEKPGACLLNIVHPPRESGLYGLMRGATYKMFIFTSWILPQSFQSYLGMFGFHESKIEIETELECSKLNKQILVEKLQT